MLEQMISIQLINPYLAVQKLAQVSPKFMSQKQKYYLDVLLTQSPFILSHFGDFLSVHHILHTVLEAVCNVKNDICSIHHQCEQFLQFHVKPNQKNGFLHLKHFIMRKL